MKAALIELSPRLSEQCVMWRERSHPWGGPYAFRSAVVGAVAGRHLWSSQMSNIEAVGQWMTIVKDHLVVEST